MILEDLFQRVILPGFTVFDIGAFEGEMTSLFSTLAGNSGRVFSFEPHPEHFLKLAESAASAVNKNIFPYCRAMSEMVGHVPIYLAPPATAKSSSIISGLGSEERLGAGVRTCLTETDTIDNFIRSFTCVPDIIKIDTEGAERLVVAGGQKTFGQIKPTIIFEGAFGYNDQRQRYCFQEEVPLHVAWLEAIGYQMYLVDVDFVNGIRISDVSPLHGSKYGLLEISAEEFKHLPEFGCNLLAVHASKKTDMDRIAPIVSGRLFDHIPSLKRQ